MKKRTGIFSGSLSTLDGAGWGAGRRGGGSTEHLGGHGERGRQAEMQTLTQFCFSIYADAELSLEYALEHSLLTIVQQAQLIP